MKKVGQELDDISLGDQKNPVANFISSFIELKKVTPYDEKTTKFTPAYLAQMCLLDTFSVLATIMIPARNNANLLAARAIALAGKDRLNVLILDKDEVKSIKWATQTQYPYSLATALAHGSGITFNYDQKLQDNLCPGQSVLKTLVLKGVDFNSTGASTHKHTYDYTQKRVVDDKHSFKLTSAIPPEVGKFLFALNDQIDAEQVRINFGDGVPFINGMISTGESNYLKTSFGAWLCFESAPTSSRVGAFTMGLETSEVLTYSLSGHLHLTGSASKTNLFLTGPKVDTLIPLLLKDGPTPKSKRDALYVSLDAQSEGLEILKMADFELKKYAVGMLLGMDRAVNNKEYGDIFRGIMAPIPSIIPRINQGEFLSHLMINLTKIDDEIHKEEKLKKATPINNPQGAILVLCKNLAKLETSKSTISRLWYRDEISALKRFVHLVQYEAGQVKEKPSQLRKSKFDLLTKNSILKPIINQFVQNGGQLPPSFIYQRDLIRDYETDSSLIF